MAETFETDDAAQEVQDEVAGRKRKTKTKDLVYKVYADSRIPVSKHAGSVWKQRKEHALKGNRDLFKAWDEAVRYYDNDQTAHRTDSGEDVVGNKTGTQRLNDTLTETENIVFANISTLVPALYAKNPKAEVTANSPESKELGDILEDLINVVSTRNVAPGVGLKAKARRCVSTALLCNRAWLEVGWTQKNDSDDEALRQLSELSNRYNKAKSVDDIEKIEGEIRAFEDSINVVNPSGPRLTFHSPKDVLIDPDAKELDTSDAKWIIVFDYLPTSFICAKYGEKDDKGEFKSIYKPTHLLKSTDSEEGVSDENYSLFNDDSEYATSGYDSREAYDRAKVTRVAYVWDKSTRRLLMYNDKDWSWPIWVWDDPYQLDRFFPLVNLSFLDGPSGPMTKGEVTYYLDQQDAINEINDEERRARAWAKRNIFYNKNVVTNPDDISSVLKGPDGTVRGLDIEAGIDIRTILSSIPTPGYQHKELFDKSLKYASIDRISSVGEVLRGGQFKTNTTDDAVQTNVAATNIKVEDKTDQIEDFVGDVMWLISQLCLMNMPQSQVASLIGFEKSKRWKNLQAHEIQSQFSVRVVGGSVKKPTSAAKKSEALELGQVLGQFTKTPAAGVIVKIMLMVMREAFDEIVITDEDWAKIDQAMSQQAPAGPEQGQGQDNVDQLLQSLSPQDKIKVATLIKQGVPGPEAVRQVTGQAIQ